MSVYWEEAAHRARVTGRSVTWFVTATKVQRECHTYFSDMLDVARLGLWGKNCAPNYVLGK